MSGQQQGNDDTDLTGSSRRGFLKTALLLAGAVGLQGLPRFGGTAAAVDPRAYTVGRFAFELDGVLLDMVRSVEGGFARADVVQEKWMPGQFPKKHLGNLQYTDIVMQCDPPLPVPLLNWLTASLGMSYQRKNGAVITADFDMNERSRLEFFNALVSELTIPACDASSKEHGALTLKLSTEYTRPVAGNGGKLPASLSIDRQKKAWLPGNFRLQIQGLETACTHINRIEAMTIKQKVAMNPIGEARDYAIEPSSLEFSNLVITLPESDAGPFYQWFDDFVVKGNSGQDRERPGFLELLASDRNTVLLRVSFNYLGIFSFSPVKQETNAENIPRVKVEMYCEQITLAPSAVAQTQSAPPPPPGQPSLPQGVLPPVGAPRPLPRPLPRLGP